MLDDIGFVTGIIGIFFPAAAMISAAITVVRTGKAVVKGVTASVRAAKLAKLKPKLRGKHATRPHEKRSKARTNRAARPWLSGIKFASRGYGMYKTGLYVHRRANDARNGTYY